jgi:hypothetical protein
MPEISNLAFFFVLSQIRSRELRDVIDQLPLPLGQEVVADGRTRDSHPGHSHDEEQAELERGVTAQIECVGERAKTHMHDSYVKLM